MPAPTHLSEKVSEVISEMKKQHLWRNTVPEWVERFNGNVDYDTEGFLSWLQFVYLPNIGQIATAGKKLEFIYVAPQAIKCLGPHQKHDKLLSLLVELDSLL